MTTIDERYMSRALSLARRPPFVSPNPRVGAVVVRDGKVIAEAWHGGPGTPHAEAKALQEIDARGATLYVNLEPCNHHGQTPPCAPAIVAAGIERVVAAMEDPDPRVRGQGFELLRSAGVEVHSGVLAEQARRLNAPFLHHRSTGRSWLTLKLAMTLDGRLAAADGSSRWITGPEARRAVQRRRLEADAVLVGAGTIAADDPLLTVREVEAQRQPVRVVVDAVGRVSPGARLFTERGGQVIVATTVLAPHETQTGWKEAGAEVLIVADVDGRVDLDELLDALGARDLVEVYCEGGPELASSLLRRGLVNRLELHLAPKLLGAGRSLDNLGPTSLSEAHSFQIVDSRRAGDDVILTLERRTPSSPAS